MEDIQDSLLVIVATYNEIDNLPRLVLQLKEQVPDADILVIDDASPDGTGNWCEESRDRYPQLNVIHREGKLGLGSAAAEGFSWALNRNYQFIATMDADLSHDPASLKTMFTKMESETEWDALIGSRYVDGGGTEGWPLPRRLASRLVNFFARLVLWLPTKDNTGAFRIYRRNALEKVASRGTLKSNDYAYLEEILWRLNRGGFLLKEHPITFRNRDSGTSKTSFTLGIRVIWQILKMGLGIWK